jgi:hypothetical protein
VRGVVAAEDGGSFRRTIGRVGLGDGSVELADHFIDVLHVGLEFREEARIKASLGGIKVAVVIVIVE